MKECFKEWKLNKECFNCEDCKICCENTDKEYLFEEIKKLDLSSDSLFWLSTMSFLFS